MLLFVFVGSLLPYIESLDSWLYEGTLDDPFNEVMFYMISKFKIVHYFFFCTERLVTQN